MNFLLVVILYRAIMISDSKTKIIVKAMVTGLVNVAN